MIHICLMASTCMSYCSNCGTECKGNINFCPNCGAKLNRNNFDTSLQTNNNNLTAPSKSNTVLKLLVAVALVMVIIIAGLWLYHSEFEQRSGTIEITVINGGYQTPYEFRIYIDDELEETGSIHWTPGESVRMTYKEKVSWDKEKLIKTCNVKVEYKKPAAKNYAVVNKTVTLEDGDKKSISFTFTG